MSKANALVRAQQLASELQMKLKNAEQQLSDANVQTVTLNSRVSALETEV